MTATKRTIASESASALHNPMNEVVVATFESHLRSREFDPPRWADGVTIAMRDTDDTEDSEEEEEELEEEEDEEDDEEEEEEDDNDLDDEDDEGEFEADVLRTTGSTNVRGPVKNGKTDVESELEDMQEVDRDGTEGLEQDGEEGVVEDEGGSDNRQVDRAIDAALRMSAPAPADGFAANI